MIEYGGDTVYQAFVASATHWPEKGFIAAAPMAARDYHPEGIEYTYSWTLAACEALQERYDAAGYGCGHRVALLLEMRPEFFFHFFALNALGAAIVPINPDYRHDEMVYQIEHSEADLIVTLEKRKLDLVVVAAECSKRPHVVAFEGFPQILPSPSVKAKAEVPGLASECGLLYTSGTTGRPKGCILTNEFYLNAGRWYLDRGGMLSMKNGIERLYNPLPLFHMNCQVVAAMAMLLSGGCLIVPDRFHPGSWWADVCATNATIVHYLGVVVPMLLNQPVSEHERAHKIRFGLGAGCEPTLHKDFERRFGFPLIEVWGMTETGRVLCNHFESRRIDTRAFGRPVSGLEALVVDSDDKELPPGKAGELIVRHTAAEPRKGFFQGYLKNEEATEEAWRNGWFHTGDTVLKDESGMLHFVDRMKNIIRRSGENIAAAEVEACIQGHDSVAQVAVLAAADDLREEEVMACVVAAEGSVLGAELAGDIFDWCNKRLAYFKAPGWIVFLDSLPTTGTQKVQKQSIFADGEDPTRHPQAHDLRRRKRRKPKT